MHPRKLESRILQAMNLANRDFGLLAAGDRILVAMSGGKDSFGLMWGLQKLQAALPYDFELVAYHLDQGQPGHDTRGLEAYMRGLGVEYEIEFQDTYTRVVEKTEPGKVYCALCSRFRRAISYKAARRHRCNKVALGHHRDDLIETFLLNVFFSGQLKSMPPRLVSDNGTEQVIRPLAYVSEAELVELGEHKGFPVVPCQLCGSQDKERKAVKRLLEELSAKYPRIRTSMLAALGNIRKTHLLDKSVNPLYAAAGGAAAARVDERSDDDGDESVASGREQLFAIESEGLAAAAAMAVGPNDDDAPEGLVQIGRGSRS